MPILGLTDRGASFPQIGVLRKGSPKVSDRQPGKDLDHFRFDADDDQAAHEFTRAYGATPRAIRIYLPFDTTDENLVAWQEHWVAGGLVRRCDGQTCVLRQRPSGKGYDDSPHPCICTTLPPDSKERCKPVGRLKVIIPELKRLAYVVALTTSIHDIKNLSEQLRALESVRGSLRGIPMILSRIEREISMPSNDGKRVRRAKWLLAVEAAPHWVSLQLQAQERAALPAAAPLALPAPMADDEDADDAPRHPAPAADLVTGEVVETITHRGPVDGEPKAKYDTSGNLHLNFRVDGKNFLAKNASPALAFLEAGDEVTVTAHPETISGKRYNVVDAVDAVTDADGDAPWEARAAAGAVFEPVGAGAADEPPM